ncbi:MAG: phosphatidylglycerophosphatase A [Acidobacteria bacterium]|nr:phosphatidylglycerophosphatase A [Acidobacteriota bacterium]
MERKRENETNEKKSLESGSPESGVRGLGSVVIKQTQDPRLKTPDSQTPDSSFRLFRFLSSSDALALFLATALGAGFIPIAPGTFGSLVGLMIAYGLISVFSFDVLLLQNSLIIVSVALAALGIWSATRAEKILDKKDASQIVIDEVCGQVISFTLIAPYLARLGSQWHWWMVAGFVLFRIFDIFKPYPLKDLQHYSGGLGVMIDDIFAGLYAAVLMSVVMFFVI